MNIYKLPPVQVWLMWQQQMLTVGDVLTYQRHNGGHFTHDGEWIKEE